MLRVRCGRRIRPRRIPRLPAPEDRVGQDHQLPRHRRQDHLGTLAGGLQPIGERLQRRVESAGRQGRHVQDAPHRLAAAGDVPRAAPSAAVGGHRCHARQRRRLAVGQRPQLGQARQQRAAQDRPHPRDAPQQVVLVAQIGLERIRCSNSRSMSSMWDSSQRRCDFRSRPTRPTRPTGPARRFCSMVRMPISWRRRSSRASSSTASSSGSGRGSALVASARWASAPRRWRRSWPGAPSPWRSRGPGGG